MNFFSLLKGFWHVGTKHYNFGAKWPRSEKKKFQHYTVYTKVGQQKVNNNQVMWHLPMKLSDTFHQNPSCTFDKIRENPFRWKMLSRLALESKGQGHSQTQKTMPQGAINMPSTKKLAGIPPITGVQLICQKSYNDLLTITEIDIPRSRVIRWIFFTAQRFLACRNQM